MTDKSELVALSETNETNDDVPAGYEVGKAGIDWHLMLRPKIDLVHPSRADAIAACREHARRVAEGSELVAELRAQLERLEAEVEALRKRDSEHMAEKSKLRATIQRHDRAMQCEQDASRAVISALRAEVERLTDECQRRNGCCMRYADERAKALAEVERITGQRDEALREMEKAQRRADALEAEVERLSGDRREYVQHVLAELDRLRETGTLGRARTGTPERPCWAFVDVDDYFEPVRWTGMTWRDSDNEELVVTRYRPIPKSTEMDDGE